MTTHQAKSSGSTPKSLARARMLVGPALAAASATLSTELRRVVEYHWGWQDADGRPAVQRGGKLLRPAFALLSAEAVGQPAERALAAGAALELIHDFTLLHDDVMDGDRERRGRATAWAVFGVGPALCAGDALVPLAQRVLLADESPARVAALASLAEATETVIAGQMLDLAFERRRDIAVADYVRMASMKTGALLGCAASLGALLAEGPPESVTALAEFGRSLGLAFQAVDDWLGIWGDPRRVGKPAASDLRQRKASLPIVIGAAHEGAAGAELRALLGGREPLSEDEIARGVALLEATDAEACTLELARFELERALASLERGAFEPVAREALRELAVFVVARES
ncbi:MAG TPA: polyprenyl synthetase family protein [Myxococcota bacterium]|nr:polyprenyl synthetase family protein [Myxococcota bacterium]